MHQAASFAAVLAKRTNAQRQPIPRLGRAKRDPRPGYGAPRPNPRGGGSDVEFIVDAGQPRGAGLLTFPC